MDIQVLYPTFSDLVDKDEKMQPEYFNYVCIHGKALYIRILRKKYQVLTRGWYPSFANKKDYNILNRVQLIAENTNWVYIMMIFKKCMQEMINWVDYSQGELF
ncbi:MAG: hypothetical protein QXQ24_08350 [Nitrososphaeria archaeon]